MAWPHYQTRSDNMNVLHVPYRLRPIPLASLGSLPCSACVVRDLVLGVQPRTLRNPGQEGESARQALLPFMGDLCDVPRSSNVHGHLSDVTLMSRAAARRGVLSPAPPCERLCILSVYCDVLAETRTS